MEDIEQIKKERDAAIEAGLRLADHLRATAPSGCLKQDERDAIAAIEALKPKLEQSKPRECVIRYTQETRKITPWGIGMPVGHEMEECGMSEILHMREVMPAPEWERWRSVGFAVMQAADHIASAPSAELASEFAIRHNAEMERVTGTKGKP